MAVTIKTYNEQLGDLIRKVVADTPLNDINTGGVLLTLLEAVASNDFENSAAILNVLELLSIDAVRNNDLDSRAADYGLTRISAIRASGFVKISDSTITKRSTNLYPIKPAPISGSTVIYVTDASTWNATDSLYIGRGTQSFEGPINYSSITNFGTFYGINLASSLQKDHLISDSVIDAQGTTDRLITTGTIVKIPANNLNPEITYELLREAVIPAGEDSVDFVEVIASNPGSVANAGINTIIAFNAPPFTGASVTNTTVFSSGRDVETDFDLRNRIKSYAQTLARGTRQSILSAIIGISDADDSKQVASAVLEEPVDVGQPAIIYLDDSRGFQPSYDGQSVDNLIDTATGKEEFVQLANFPLPRPQVVNVADGPYQLTDGSILKVTVDEDEEIVQFNATQFNNISAATLPEVVVAINNQATIFKCRLDQNSTRLLIYPTVFDAEIIQVQELKNGEDATLYANSIIKFPTSEYSYISLYKNNIKLKEKEKSATLTTSVFNTWNILVASTLIISVDGTPAQTQTFDTSDFGGIPFTSLDLNDWVSAFNKKFAGVEAFATSGQTMRIISNKSGDESSLAILGGTLVGKWFPDLPTEAVGQTSQFTLSRQSGNIRIVEDILPGDEITAGSEDTKGSQISISTTSGNYNLSTDAFSRPSEMVVVADASRVFPRSVNLTIGSTVTLTDEGSSTMRIMSNTPIAFRDVQPGDYVYLTNRGDNAGTGLQAWFDIASSGLYKVISKGEHTTNDVDTYIEVKNPDMVIGGPYTVQSNEDIQAFSSDVYPQIWRASTLPAPAVTTVQQLADSLNTYLINVIGSVYKSNSVKLTSSSEADGSIAIPISVGNAKNVFEGRSEEQLGNQSHIANRSQNKDVVTYFKRTKATKENVYLGRYTAQDIKGALTANATPGTEGMDPYSEQLQANGTLTDAKVEASDLISFTKGANKGQYRSIKELLTGDELGTQFNKPPTIMDHSVGDEIQVIESLQISADDSIVTILDKDSTAKTVDIALSRTGKVNSGSQASTFLPTLTAFSADDADNEPGVDFGTPQVWSTTLNKTDFKDYAIWMRAHNWYASGGVGSALGKMILRAGQYGPTGEKFKFNIDYPIVSDKTNDTAQLNSPNQTLFTYVFGSGPQRVIGLSSGDTFQVATLGGDNVRLDFNANLGVNLNTVQVGDVLSFLSDSGISIQNRGQFRVNAVNAGAKTIDIYNPNASLTSPGNAEVTQVTTIADIVGTSAEHTVTTVADVGGSLDATYFILQDSLGTVAVWFDVDNNGTAEPLHGADRSIAINTINTGDADTVVANKIAAVLSLDTEFAASVLGNVVTVTNTIIGILPAGNAGTSGFTVTQTQPGTNSASLDGLFFKLFDMNGSVAVWFDVDNDGTPEPIHSCDRSLAVTSILSGDSANTIAGKISAVVNGDTEFISSFVGNVITITDQNNGNRTNATAQTSGFAITTLTNGTNAVPETVLIATSVQIYPLLNKSVQDICDKINEKDILIATPVGTTSLEIPYATREENYTPAGVPPNYTNSLSYGHHPDDIYNSKDSVGMYDGENWAKTFANANPNFIVKKPYLLVGASTVYSMDTAPNTDTVEIGEYLKLIPTTLENIKHHLSQKALSQLAIVAGVDTANNDRRVQIKSKLLGSDGAVEVVGGRGNSAQFYIQGDAQAINQLSEEFTEIKIPAFPETLNVGDSVLMQNESGVERKSRLKDSDTIQVADIAGDNVEYRYNPKQINFSEYVKIAITDVSASYAKSAGTVWRWTHNDAGSQILITADSNGSVGVQPDDYVSNGLSGSPALQRYILNTGSVSTALTFKLELSDLPAQSDYYTFQDTAGVTFAVHYDINAANIDPTGTSFTAATNKIKVSILSTDTPNQALSKTAIAILANTPFNNSFSASQSLGANLDEVNDGDLVYAYGTLTTGWHHTNRATEAGDDKVSGYCVVGVNSLGRYFDIVNPLGKAMTINPIGVGGTVQICPAPVIKWHLNHSARKDISQILVSAGVATISVTTPHELNIGDTFDILNNLALPSTPGSGIGTVVSVISTNQFTYATGVANGTYLGGTIHNAIKETTRYKIEKLGFNDLVRISRTDGQTPKFMDCGVAVDDYVVISGNTFNNNNNGRFRVLAIDNESFIIKNPSAKEELHTLRNFNNTSVQVNWVASATVVTGSAGAFENVKVGDWVKKQEDDDTYYRQVINLAPATPSLATTITLGSSYGGTTGSSFGITFDQNSDVEQGVLLSSCYDIGFYEGDSSVAGDSLFIDSLVNLGWFGALNSGTFPILMTGTDATTQKPFLRVANLNGVAQTAVLMSVQNDGLAITEDSDFKFSSVRKIAHIAIDEFNPERRIVYLEQSDRIEKFTESNRTSITALGKIGYSTDVVTGIDGYIYYTGLMRTAQRVIDGFEPDQENFPGRRAVGGLIELLPPLINRIQLSLDVTTQDGVNLGEIANEIKSAIIRYIDEVGVGEDVILSEMIARVMGIKGVAAVTFVSPAPSTERIAIARNEKAFIQAEDISIS